MLNLLKILKLFSGPEDASEKQAKEQEQDKENDQRMDLSIR